MTTEFTGFCPHCRAKLYDPDGSIVECACGSLAEGWEPLFGAGWAFVGWRHEESGLELGWEDSTETVVRFV